ncbi:MAG: hypothetical protein QOD84_407 [Acidobacteriaceae bacterium]|jgi:hypothetical protein
MNDCSINSKRGWTREHNFRGRKLGESWAERLNWDAILATVAICSISAASWSAIAAAISHLTH